MPTQSLSGIVNITVEVSPTAPAVGNLNLGLIVGPSLVITNTTRTAIYSGLSDMTANGWAGTEPEYLAAEAYFAQSPRPSDVVIGRQGTASTTLAAALTSGTAYTTLSVAALTGNIAAGDTLTIGSGATTQSVVASAAASAGATSIAVTSFTANANYAIGADVGNSETLVQAVTACRASNTNWYGSYACGAADADVEAIAAYIESVTPLATYFYDTQSADVASGTTPNVMSTLQADKYQRTTGLYHAIASEYAGAAEMGYAMGANTGLANSAYTLAHKTLVGITPDDLTTQQVTNIQGWNGNVYTSWGGKYNLLESGVVANGTPYDEIINIDTLVSNAQDAVMAALTGTPKIPQTDAGVSILVNDLSEVCAEAATEGILAPGIWTAAPVLGLQTGTNLPAGYIVLADTIENQSQADRTARKSPPIYMCVKMAGAIQEVVIGLVVNQ